MLRTVPPSDPSVPSTIADVAGTLTRADIDAALYLMAGGLGLLLVVLVAIFVRVGS
jgi:hypothetical protein